MRCERLESPAPLGPRVGRGTGPPCYPAEKRRSPSTGQMTPGDPARGVLLHTPGVREPETGSKSLKTGSQSLIRPASFVPYFFNRESDNLSAFEFQDTGLLKKKSPDLNMVTKIVTTFIIQPTLSQMWPEQLGWAAICVQDFDAPCVLQFAWISALCCALHRSTSLVIHRSGSFLITFFAWQTRQSLPTQRFKRQAVLDCM